MRDGTDSERAATAARRALPDALPIDYILDTDWYCVEFSRELGEEPRAHASADDYILDDLAGMFEHTECPLCIHPDYDAAPMGVWARDVNEAGDALDRLTKGHTGDPIPEDTRNLSWQATAGQLRDLWRQFPHARWWYEKNAQAGDMTIQVVDA